jgi:hypothetical protein
VLYCNDIATSQDNQGKETSKEKVQKENKRKNSRNKKKNPVGARFFALVQTDPETHPASYTVSTG